MIGKDSHQETTCWRCYTSYVLPRALYVAAKASGMISFYCPYGHEACFAEGETEEDKLRRERDRLKQQLAQRDDEIRTLHSSVNEERRVSKQLAASAFKARTRAKAGTCPCCNRTFKQMALHMQNKHPNFKVEMAA